jgi:hypothetical protein
MLPLDKLRDASLHDQPATLSKNEVRVLLEMLDRIEDKEDPPDFVERGLQENAIQEM